MHYVNVNVTSNLSDLVGTLEWLKANDDEARRIAHAGRAAALTHGSTECVAAYWLEVLRIIANGPLDQEGNVDPKQRQIIPEVCG